MKFYNRKSLIPVETLILVGHLLPLISVFNSDLDYMHLIALFYFDFVLLMFFGFIKLFAAPYSFLNSNTLPEEGRIYKRKLRKTYAWSHLFVLVFYTLFISMPIGMYLNFNDSLNNNFSDQLYAAFNFRVFWLLLALLIVAQMGELIAFFIKPISDRSYAEDIAYISYREFMIVYLVVIFGAIFCAGTQTTDGSRILWRGVIFGTGFTIVKLYFENNRLKKMLRRDASNN